MSYRFKLSAPRRLAVVFTLAPVAALKLLQAASGTPPPQFHLASWFPVDITADPVKGVLVVERHGQISRVFSDETGLHQEVLFSIAEPEIAQTVTASADAAYVAASSRNGCRVFRYTFATQEVAHKSVSPASGCDGIAAAGHTLFVLLAKTKQLELWENWDSESPRAVSLEQLQRPGFLVFDKVGQRLLLTDSPMSLSADMKSPQASNLMHQMPITDFRVYAVSVVNGKVSLVTSGIGQRITSIAPHTNHIFIASGKRVSLIRRSDNHSEKLPPALEIMTGGDISGVASDASGNIWYADMSKGTIAGPLAIE